MLAPRRRWEPRATRGRSRAPARTARRARQPETTVRVRRFPRRRAGLPKPRVGRCALRGGPTSQRVRAEPGSSTALLRGSCRRPTRWARSAVARAPPGAPGYRCRSIGRRRCGQPRAPGPRASEAVPSMLRRPACGVHSVQSPRASAPAGTQSTARRAIPGTPAPNSGALAVVRRSLQAGPGWIGSGSAHPPRYPCP